MLFAHHHVPPLRRYYASNAYKKLNKKQKAENLFAGAALPYVNGYASLASLTRRGLVAMASTTPLVDERWLATTTYVPYRTDVVCQIPDGTQLNCGQARAHLPRAHLPHLDPVPALRTPVPCNRRFWCTAPRTR